MTEDFPRLQFIMADHGVNSVIEASIYGESPANRSQFEMAIRAALVANSKYEAKHGGWRERMGKNFNSANDEEMGR